MIAIRQLLESKGDEVYIITPGESVFEALERMARYDVGALVVVEGKELVGIISERDYARKVILKGHASRNTRVEEIMSHNPVSVGLDDSITNCMTQMTEHRVRHLPVLEGRALKGIISIGDVVKAIISQQAFHIEQLEGYISGQ